MDVCSVEPSTFGDLLFILVAWRNDFPALVLYLRELELLPKTGICPRCGTETELEVPTSDDPKEMTRFTRCSNAICARESNYYERKLFFKHRTIFAHSRKPMQVVLLVVFCFSVLMNAQLAANVCSYKGVERGSTRHDPRYISHDAVSELYERMRCATEHWVETFHK
jgi:hypothetical protein